MMIMRSSSEAQAAAKDVPFEEILAAMSKYNHSLVDAGVLLGAEGLAGPEEGFVVDFGSDPPTVSDEPLGHELLNGFWIIAVSSKEEAQQWASRCPLGPGVTLEVRRIQEIEDFPQDNEYVQKEIHWRSELAK